MQCDNPTVRSIHSENHRDNSKDQSPQRVTEKVRGSQTQERDTTNE